LPNPSRLLKHIAAAVADGAMTDWDEVDQRLVGSPFTKSVAGLRLVQQLSLQGSTSTATPVEAPGASLALRALFLLAGAQVVLAILGVLFGEADRNPLPALPVLLAAIVFGGAGVVLGRAGRRDRRVLYLGGCFLCIASATSLRFVPLAAPLLPSKALLPVFTAVLPECFLPFFLWRFVREFPRAVRLDRWARVVDAAVLTTGLVGALLCALNVFAFLAPDSPISHLAVRATLLRQRASLYWLLLCGSCLPAPLVAWARSRLAGATERRRVRWFLFGLALGFVPLFGAVVAATLSPAFDKYSTQPESRAWLAVVLNGFLLTLPLTTTYAVVAHHLLPLRLLLRRAARLTLARRSLAVLGLLPGFLLVSYLYRQRARPLTEILLQPPGPALLAWTALGWAAFSLRGTLLGRVQGLLMKGRRDLALVLASFGRDAKAVRTAQELSSTVSRCVIDLVAAEHATLLLRDGPETYRGVERGLRPLASSSAFARLVGSSPEPATVAEEGPDSLFPWLIEADRQWVADADAHLIAPVLGGDGQPQALLVLGGARGGLPYTRDEKRVIAAFASAASLATETIVERAPFLGGDLRIVDQPAGQCLRCGRVEERAEGRCACGQELVPAAIPYELAGKFRLEAVLGKGGMGIVYRALDLALERVVALKTLPHLRADALVRLRREARSMAGFLHPNLALIFGLETWRGVPVLVVEYLAKGSLAPQVTTPQAPRKMLRLTADVAAALEVMHARGLLHRDVKPSNIGLAADGTPKLLDFGLAHLVEESQLDLRNACDGLDAREDSDLAKTLTGHVVGTPLYLSPEALAGAPPSPAQDLWSLHLVLWESIAGRHPCAGKSLPMALRSLARGNIPDIRTVRPDCPSTIAELLVRGLSSDPRLRPPTASAVRDSLLRAAEEA